MLVDDNGFDLLGPHHRADAAAGGKADGAVFLVRERDAGDQAAVFGDRAANADRNLVAVFFVKQGGGLEQALPQVRFGVIEGDLAFLGDADDDPIRRRT